MRALCRFACSLGAFELETDQVPLPNAAQALRMLLRKRRGSLERARRAKVQGVR
jgi:hypothetical protein